MKRLLSLIALLLAISAFSQENSSLLFYLSGENGASADFSQGSPNPNYLSRISVIPDGVSGKAIHCDTKQAYTYRAPGNIYSKKGTLAFFWRSGMHLTGTAFPIFRVAFADHSSWDMVWLRIDWNGHGFEGFVTDNNLARIRVKKDMAPADDEWVHIAISWDEGKGVRLYLDGEPAACRDTSLVLDTGLDQFGPHSRIISPYQVHSMYNMQRGGDLDELRIYSEMLTDSEIAALARAEAPEAARHPGVPANEWNRTLGFDKNLPPYMKNRETTVKRIGILEAYDIKRWYWKANDGIRETTWPGVYNRSRIEGRNDYFQLPDWDCYFDSGKKVRFNMPDEPWNYLEMIGGAFGELGLTTRQDGENAVTFAHKDKGTQHLFQMMDQPVRGQTITFSNVQQETPIQEFNAFYVHEGAAPTGVAKLSYGLSDFYNFEDSALKEMESYIAGRFEPEARTMLIALPGEGKQQVSKGKGLPIVHIVIPSDTRDLNRNVALEIGKQVRSTSNSCWDLIRGGLDGILLELPALEAKEQDGLIPLTIRIKDPVWKLRDMLDFSFSVKRGEARSIWFDLRDRILPEGRPLYITIASSSEDFDAEMLADARISLIFKSAEKAKEEHVKDRLTQVVDNYAMIVEENTKTRRLDKFNQIDADMRDLFRVDPDNKIGRSYWNIYYGEQVAPEYTEPGTPDGIPEWAFTQLELLKEYRYLISWYLENREIENGELGGGISDDSDYTNYYPGFAAMGMMPDRLTDGAARLMEAVYDQGMLTDGVSTIKTDGLHTYEEGVNLILQMNILQTGNPKQAERMMETARNYRDRLFGVNDAGHVHMRSDFFSATEMSTEGLWAWSTMRSYFHCAPAMIMGELYGIHSARKLLISFMDSMLAHAKPDARGKLLMPEDVNFNTDEVRSWGWNNSMPPLWFCWLWTGNPKYRVPIDDSGWIRSVGDKEAQVREYRNQLRILKTKEFLYTKGSIWTDRIQYSADAIQIARLGAPAMNRISHYAPSNPVAWRFEDEENSGKVAIWVHDCDNSHFSVEFYNTDRKPVKVKLIGAQSLLGDWELVKPDGKIQALEFGRTRSVDLILPKGESHISMRLTGEAVPYDSLTDLGISSEDIRIEGDKVAVTLHNVSGQDAEPMKVSLVNASGKTISSMTSPRITAPEDLLPKTAVIRLAVPAGTELKGCRIVIDPDNEITELYETNNSVTIDKK